MYQVVDPLSGTVIEVFDHAPDGEVSEALEASADELAHWRSVPFKQRAVIVKQIADLFAELAAIATLEMGKPIPEGAGEVELCNRGCRRWSPC